MASRPYLRNLLDMIGVTPDFTTCGDFKSASEMFMRNGPSPAAQENLDWLMDGIFAHLPEPDRQRSWCIRREGPGRGSIRASSLPSKPKEAGVIDAVQFRQDFVAELKEEIWRRRSV